MSDPASENRASNNDEPTRDDPSADNSSPDGAEIDPLTEPSVNKQPEEQPKADNSDEPEPSHHAIGIGVIHPPDDEDNAPPHQP